MKPINTTILFDQNQNQNQKLQKQDQKMCEDKGRKTYGK